MDHSQVDRELHPGEKMLWEGKPARGIRLQPSDAIMIPFSIMWGGFAIVWELGVTGAIHLDNKDNHAPFFFALWGVPFVLIGLYMMVGRFFSDAKIRANTDYAITNERAIILSGFSSRKPRKVQSINLKSIPDISMNEKIDGSGTITFGGTYQSYSMRRGYSNPLAFKMIPDVRNVNAILSKAQKGE